MGFELFIGIDYSGAETAESRMKGLQVYATAEGPPQPVPAVPEEGKRHWNWCRAEIAEYLMGLVAADTTFIAGIDHGFSMPRRYFEEYNLTSWGEFLADFVEHWPTHEPNTRVETILRKGPPRTGKTDEFRITDRWTSSAKSVFLFGVQGQVAMSTHAGIPWLWIIRERLGDMIHFWPFDGWTPPDGKSVIVEVYPSVFHHRYPKEDRSSDQHDAYSAARWLWETSNHGFLEKYLHPPLTESDRQAAELEGWILGIA
jgi:hypothetical protein